MGDRCEGAWYCEGHEVVQVHVVEPDSYLCVKCAVGEERRAGNHLTQANMRESLREPEWHSRIHRVKSRQTHKDSCDPYGIPEDRMKWRPRSPAQLFNIGARGPSPVPADFSVLEYDHQAYVRFVEATKPIIDWNRDTWKPWNRCLRQLRRPHHICPRRCRYECFGTIHIDHHKVVMTHSGLPLLISHPYQIDHEESWDEASDRWGLSTYTSDQSWYYPGTSLLEVIGATELVQVITDRL